MIEKSLRKRDGIYSPWIWGLFAAVIFACLYLFFTRISPLYIHDLDDWVYVYNFRRPLPSVKELNPIKVLPETWMPMVSYLGTYLVYPFVGDIFTAWAMTYAAFLSLVITVYILSAVGLLSRWFHIENWTLRMLYCGIFLLAHFVPFLQENRMSDHLFLARDITCIFNYTIPTLINLIFWMYFFDQDSQWKSLSPEKTGYLWLGLYLSIFSSLFQSIVLMSLFGMQLLFALIGSIRENIHQKKTWIDMTLIQDYIKLHYPKLLALVIWFISMGFQLGGRAKDISGPMQMNMILAALWKILTQKLNPYFCRLPQIVRTAQKNPYVGNIQF